MATQAIAVIGVILADRDNPCPDHPSRTERIRVDPPTKHLTTAVRSTSHTGVGDRDTMSWPATRCHYAERTVSDDAPGWLPDDGVPAATASAAHDIGVD